nr:MAG TPA: hypothetical protein [Caudoviricetes sp.]
MQNLYRDGKWKRIEIYKCRLCVEERTDYFSPEVCQ